MGDQARALIKDLWSLRAGGFASRAIVAKWTRTIGPAFFRQLSSINSRRLAAIRE